MSHYSVARRKLVQVHQKNMATYWEIHDDKTKLAIWKSRLFSNFKIKSICLCLSW